jgi:hypothetical protein
MNQYAPEVTHADAVRFGGLGHVCHDLINGATIQQQVDLFGRNNLATDVGDGALKGATDGYCPQFKQALTNWVNSQP